jgi:hypothetical protein
MRDPGRRWLDQWLACALAVFVIGFPHHSFAQGNEAGAPRVVLVPALGMLDVRSGRIVEDAALAIER